MSFQVSYVANQTKEVGKKQIYELKKGTLTPSTTEVVYSTRKQTIIDSLEVSASEPTQCGLRIVAYVNGVQKVVEIISGDGLTSDGFYIKKVLESTSSLFDIVSYDTVNNKYKIALKEPLYFPEGCVISRRNESTTASYSVGVVLLGREF